jgi:hypothetical protein
VSEYFELEKDLSAAVRLALIEWTMQGRWYGEAFHVENEVQPPKGMLPHQRIKFFQKRKRIGVMPGADDWVFFWDGGYTKIELKPSTSKKLSTAQMEYMTRCFEKGIPYNVCYTVAEVEAVLVEAGGLNPVITPTLNNI